MKKSVFTIVVLITAVFTMTACDSGSSTSNKKPVRGYARVDAPLVGATVSVYDVNGNQILKKENVTGALGTFYLQISESDLAEKIVIEVTDGSIGENGEMFYGTLRAVICTYNEEQSYYELNPVTTLAAAYSEAYPEADCSATETVIKDFLTIPEEIDIFTELRHTNPHFVPEIFVTEMTAAGGLEIFLKQLLGEVDEHNQVHSFGLQSANVLTDVEDSVATSLLKKIAEGAASEVGGQMAGWAVSKIFGQDTPNPPLSSAEFNSQMSQLHSQLNDIQQSVAKLKTQINSAVQEILTGQDKISYNTDAALLDSDVATVQTLDQRMGWLTAAAADEQEGVDSEARDLIDKIDTADLLTVLNHINAVLTGASPGQQGLLELWGNVVFSKSYSTKHFDELNQEFNYWANLQVQALNLLIESEHYHYPDTQGNSIHYLETYQNNMAPQVELFIRSVEQQITLWWALNETQASLDNFQGKTLDGEIYFVDYQEENTVLHAAQSLAAGFQNQTGGLIIWVQMYSFLHLNGVHLDQPSVGSGQEALQLRNVETGLIYTPQNFTTYNFDQASWSRPLNHDAYDSTTDIARYDFGTSLPSGTYQITDNYNNVFSNCPTPLPQTYLDFHISIDSDHPIHNMLILFMGHNPYMW